MLQPSSPTPNLSETLENMLKMNLYIVVLQSQKTILSGSYAVRNPQKKEIR